MACLLIACFRRQLTNTIAGCDLHAHQISCVGYDLELNVLDIRAALCILFVFLCCLAQLYMHIRSNDVAEIILIPIIC